MTPYEQEMLDKDPNHVSKGEIEKRITSVKYQSTDYGNIAECTISIDNGARFYGRGSNAKTNLDVAQTAAYAEAYGRLQEAFNFLRAEQLYWVRAQQRELGMLAAFGVQDGD